MLVKMSKERFVEKLSTDLMAADEIKRQKRIRAERDFAEMQHDRVIQYYRRIYNHRRV